MHVVTGEALASGQAPAQLDRTAREPRPEPREQDRRDQPERNRIERLRAERPGGEIRQAAQRQREPPA